MGALAHVQIQHSATKRLAGLIIGVACQIHLWRDFDVEQIKCCADFNGNKQQVDADFRSDVDTTAATFQPE